MTIFAFVVLIAAASPAFAIFYDLSNGNPGLQSPCPPSNPLTGVWTEEDASQYETSSSGSMTGLVLKSESGAASCIRTPGLFDVYENFTFQMNVYLPDALNVSSTHRKVQVWLVDSQDNSVIITEMTGPSIADWYTVEQALPPGDYLDQYYIEIWAHLDIEFIALRWFGLSDDSSLSTPEPMTTQENTPQGLF
ncbi:Hypothetical predicted protein [Cloeon dipterum]|uniref:MAM domain-containing protein n=1 Tax=Cloeon dipterum TaxID=197152 RepID=A0A8S1DT51_9INSE|nr:Hypothetical predicted protein [Cloeon dipterum]